jgi:hypothetical protein
MISQTKNVNELGGNDYVEEEENTAERGGLTDRDSGIWVFGSM